MILIKKIFFKKEKKSQTNNLGFHHMKIDKKSIINQNQTEKGINENSRSQ